MRNRIFLALIVFFVLFLVCFSSSLAHYSFLSSEVNEALENLKEKHSEVLSKVSYQYYYSAREDVVKVEFVTCIKDEDDQVLCAEIVDAKIGDIFIGGSKVYVLQEQTVLTQAQIEHLFNQGIIVIGEWAVLR